MATAADVQDLVRRLATLEAALEDRIQETNGSLAQQQQAIAQMIAEAVSHTEGQAKSFEEIRAALAQQSQTIAELSRITEQV